MANITTPGTINGGVMLQNGTPIAAASVVWRSPGTTVAAPFVDIGSGFFFTGADGTITLSAAPMQFLDAGTLQPVLALDIDPYFDPSWADNTLSLSGTGIEDAFAVQGTINMGLASAISSVGTAISNEASRAAHAENVLATRLDSLGGWHGTLTVTSGMSSVSTDQTIVVATSDDSFSAAITLALADLLPSLNLEGPLFPIGPSERVSPIYKLDLAGEIYLGNGANVVPLRQLGFTDTAPNMSAPISGTRPGSGYLYIEFNGATSVLPQGITLGAPLENINDCRLYFSTFGTNALSQFTLSNGGEGDQVAQIVTDPATAVAFGAALSASSSPQTISLGTMTGNGRLYFAVVDENVTIPVTLTSAWDFDTSITAAMSSGTEPHPTGVWVGGDVTLGQSIAITITPTGAFNAPAYLGALLESVPIPSYAAQLYVPPFKTQNNGTVVSSAARTLVNGPGIDFSGDANTTTINNTGVLGIVQGTNTAQGNITVVGGSLSGNTLVIGAEISFGGSCYGTLVAGPNTTLTPGTGTLADQLTISSAAGGGGGGGGGSTVSFVQVYTFTSESSFEVPMDLGTYDYEMVCRVSAMTSSSPLLMRLGHGTPGAGTYYGGMYGYTWGQSTFGQEPADYFNIDNANVNSNRLSRVRILADPAMYGGGAQVEFASYYSQTGGVFSTGGDNVITLAQFLVSGFAAITGTVTVYQYPRS
jgi:hypothetical protein